MQFNYSLYKEKKKISLTKVNIFCVANNEKNTHSPGSL